ncbi:MAG: hypothetical protein IPH13_17880 [Planctomycetes bacterium]|nr:hypothetical protein [Planctomycetota bacterium]MCC7170215.1 hypothetical protein [Planctomycetota bacterium]
MVLVGFNTNSNGSFTLPAQWPAGVPSGRPIFAQALVQDAGAPFGVAISNAIVGETP